MQMLTQFAESSSGIAALGFDGKAFLIQLVTFILSYMVLRRYAFGPILKVLQQRRETIKSSVMLAEQLQKEKAELESEVEKTLHEARQKSDTIIAEAQDAGRQSILEAEDKGRQKAGVILADAEERIKQDTFRARRALEKEVVGLVADVTEAIIDEKVDATKDMQLIERLIRERNKDRVAA